MLDKLSQVKNLAKENLDKVHTVVGVANTLKNLDLDVDTKIAKIDEIVKELDSSATILTQTIDEKMAEFEEDYKKAETYAHSLIKTWKENPKKIIVTGAVLVAYFGAQYIFGIDLLALLG